MKYLIATDDGVDSEPIYDQIVHLDNHAVYFGSSIVFVESELSVEEIKSSVLEALPSGSGLVITQLNDESYVQSDYREEHVQNKQTRYYSLKLTPRQMEIFQLIGEAKGTTDIAKLLHVSIHTVESHRENIKRKLGIKSSQELMKAAVLLVNNISSSHSSSFH